MLPYSGADDRVSSAAFDSVLIQARRPITVLVVGQVRAVRSSSEWPHHALPEERKEMVWFRHRGEPPGLRRLPKEDQPSRPAPLLTQPFDGGLTGWIVVSGAVIAELAGGAAVANQASTAIAVTVLLFPVVVVFGFAVVQWWQVRSAAAEPAPWWHLAGVAAAVVTWLIWPTVPGPLTGTTAIANTNSGPAFCHVLPTGAAVADCLHRTARAFDLHNLAWWSTGALILIAALLARRSRIAAWGAIPVALAGCQLAAYFLNQIVLYYHLG